MRSTQTFILRLLVDTADPKELRGSIRSVIDGEERPFSDEEALLSLIHTLIEGVNASQEAYLAELTPDGEIDGLQEM